MACVYYITQNEGISTDINNSDVKIEVHKLNNGYHAVAITNDTSGNVALNLDIVESADNSMIGVDLSNVSIYKLSEKMEILFCPLFRWF